MSAGDSHQSIRDKLASEVLAAPWADLWPHHSRGALLLVAPGVDLVSLAVALALDDVPTVEGALASGTLGRLPDAVAEAWMTDAPTFRAVIVQPWVLAQVAPPSASPISP